jgi:hypothetical protein
MIEKWIKNKKNPRLINWTKGNNPTGFSITGLCSLSHDVIDIWKRRGMTQCSRKFSRKCLQSSKDYLS